MPPFTVSLARGASLVIAAESPEQAARIACARLYGPLAYPVRTTGPHGGPGHFRPYRHLPRNRQTAIGAAFRVSPERSHSS